MRIRIDQLSNVTTTSLMFRLAGCIIVNVEYRLAPEHKFPASIEDATTVVNWVKQNKTKIGDFLKNIYKMLNDFLISCIEMNTH